MPTWLIKLFHSLGRKQAAKRTGIAQIPTTIDAEGKGAYFYTVLREAGFTDKALTKLIKSEQDIIRLVNKVESMGNQRRQIKKGVEELAKKPPFQGFTPKVIEGGKPKEGITGISVNKQFTTKDRILQIDDELEKLVAKEGKYGKMSRNDRENLMIKLQDESSTLQEKTLFKDSPEAIAKIKADNKAAVESLKKKKIKSKEPVGLFANEQEFAEELSSIRGNLIKNDPDFNLQIAETYLKPGKRTYGWTPTGDESKLLSPKQRQKVLDNIRDVMKNDEYQYQFREDFDFTEMTDDMFRTDKASGGLARVGMVVGGSVWKKFIEGLFIKTSNNIRQGKGKWKGLNQDQWMKQHDDLTKMLKKWEMSGKKGLPEGAEQFIGMNDLQVTKAIKDATSEVEINKVLNKAYDEVAGGSGFSDDYKMAADQLSDSIAEQLGKNFDDLSQTQQTQIQNIALKRTTQDLKKRLSQPKKTLEGLESKETIDISDPEVADEFSRFIKESDPEGYKKLEQKIQSDDLFDAEGKLNKKAVLQEVKDSEEKMLLDKFDVKGRTKQASGGRIGFADGDEVFDPLEGAFDDILEEIKKQRRKRKAEELKDIKNWDPQNPTYHASGGIAGQLHMNEGGRVPMIFGGSPGLKAMIASIKAGLNKGRKDKVKTLFPKYSAADKEILRLGEKYLPRDSATLAAREIEAKAEGIQVLIDRLKHDKKLIAEQAKNKAKNDPSLDFLMESLEKTMPEAYGPHLKKYTNIDKDILQLETIKKNLIMKDRKLNAEGGRASLSNGGLANILGV